MNKFKITSSIIICILIVVIILLMNKNANKISQINDFKNLIKNKDLVIKDFKDKNGLLHKRYEQISADKEVIKLVYQSKIDSISKLLKVKPKQITSHKEIYIQGEKEIIPIIVNKTDTITKENNFTLKYSDNWLQVYGNGIVFNNDLKSLKLDYKTTDSIYITEITKKRLFRSSKTIIDIHSANPNNVITGVQQFTVKHKPKKFGLGVQLGYGFNGMYFTPYIGLGVQYSVIRF